MNPKPRFWILDEQHNVVPVDDVLTWARWFEVDSNRALDFTSWQARPGMPARELSTIFVGLEPVSSMLERDDTDPPLVFETMVFTRDADGRRRSVESYRWATWDEAMQAHRRIFERINADDMQRAEAQLARRIAAVFVFPNGMVAVTDQHGEQWPEFQGHRDEALPRIREACKANAWKPEWKECRPKKMPANATRSRTRNRPCAVLTRKAASGTDGRAGKRGGSLM
jgi:hypothetical protein